MFTPFGLNETQENMYELRACYIIRPLGKLILAYFVKFKYEVWNVPVCVS